MVQSNELRIGNLVIAQESRTASVINGEITRIFSITEDGSGEYGYNSIQGGMPDFYDCDPIPLTPEIMKMVGFEDGNEKLSLEVNGYVSILFMFNIFPLVLDVDGNRMPLHEVKYFHQLQNLYYLFKGKELETKNLLL